ncbi:YraN family protein [Candidatus Desantisbacteria bacterium]|nr:YraN family protein [Candidatus Desantisbacteria bacterium]
MTYARIKLGQCGEEKAADYLVKQRIKILEKNYRCGYGEIDIIAKDKDTLVFVEVKTRKTSTYLSPLLAVNKHKQLQISKVALHYLLEKKLKEIPCRFDVVTVVDEEIQWIKGAFERGI